MWVLEVLGVIGATQVMEIGVQSFFFETDTKTRRWIGPREIVRLLEDNFVTDWHYSDSKMP